MTATTFRRRHQDGQPARTLVSIIMIAALLLLTVGEQRASATSYMLTYSPWQRDPKSPLDRVPPERPRLELIKLVRGRNVQSDSTSVVRRLGMRDSDEATYTWASGGGLGWLRLALLGKDDHTSQDSLGWRIRVVTGHIEGIPGYRFRILPPHTAEPGAREVDFHWVDWTPEQSGFCCPIRAGLVATCFDLAGNESPPSDTLWVISVGR